MARQNLGPVAEFPQSRLECERSGEGGYVASQYSLAGQAVRVHPQTVLSVRDSSCFTA